VHLCLCLCDPPLHEEAVHSPHREADTGIKQEEQLYNCLCLFVLPCPPGCSNTPAAEQDEELDLVLPDHGRLRSHTIKEGQELTVPRGSAGAAGAGSEGSELMHHAADDFEDDTATLKRRAQVRSSDGWHLTHACWLRGCWLYAPGRQAE
jgi:hypothetical protein